MKSKSTRVTFTFDDEALKDLAIVEEFLRSPSSSYAVRRALEEYRKQLQTKHKEGA
jgi:hypothetical protein